MDRIIPMVLGVGRLAVGGLLVAGTMLALGACSDDGGGSTSTDTLDASADEGAVDGADDPGPADPGGTDPGTTDSAPDTPGTDTVTDGVTADAADADDVTADVTGDTAGDGGDASPGDTASDADAGSSDAGDSIMIDSETGDAPVGDGSGDAGADAASDVSDAMADSTSDASDASSDTGADATDTGADPGPGDGGGGDAVVDAAVDTMPDVPPMDVMDTMDAADPGPGDATDAVDTVDAVDSGPEDTGPAPECATDVDCVLLLSPGQCDRATCQLPAGTCSLGPRPDGTTCDDADECTLDDTCQAGTCEGGDPRCDDGDQCTDNLCDPGTLECSYPPAEIPVCDDDNACTDLDFCRPDGSCLGIAMVCNDDNPCTLDTCNTTTGQCIFVPSEGDPCVGDDPCLVFACNAAGGCAPTGSACDDENACTDDFCNAMTGECSHENITCADGDICTDDSCLPAVGCIFVTADTCGSGLPYETAFDCGEPDWTYQILMGEVTWAVDATPATPGYTSPDCSLNMNSTKFILGYDSGAAPTATTATSPVIDAQGSPSLWLGYFDWYDIDDPPGSGRDLREVRVSNDGFATWTALNPGHTLGGKGLWTYRAFDLSAFADNLVQVQFWFNSVDPNNNSGKGWFVDDLVISATEPSKPPEICDDLIDNDYDGTYDCSDLECRGSPLCPEVQNCFDDVDNDLDGIKDCADPDCQAGEPTCVEANYCTDGIDNDLNGTTDCFDLGCEADPACCQARKDCATDRCSTADCDLTRNRCVLTRIECVDGDPCTTDDCDPDRGCDHVDIPVCPATLPYSNTFQCTDRTLTRMTLSGTISWEVDDLPNPPGFNSASCSLNFNDNDSINPSYDSPTDVASTGTATTLPIDASAAGSVWLSFASWWDTGDEPGSGFDNLEIHISSNDFATWTTYDPGHFAGVNQSQWIWVLVDASAFAGTTFQVRFWFDSVDEKANSGVGWFIDDLVISETQPPSPI